MYYIIDNPVIFFLIYTYSGIDCYRNIKVTKDEGSHEVQA